MANETKFQKQCLEYLKELVDSEYPISYTRRDATGRTYKKGSADLWCTVNGYHLEIELKDVDGSPTPMQILWERKCKFIHTPYLRTDSFEEFKKFIDKFLQLSPPPL